MHSPRVVSLHRYPVKSMLGEDLTSLEIDVRGVAGDRMWSVRTPDDKIGSGKNTRRFAAVIGLLGLRAQLGDGRVVVTFPDGTRCFTDDVDAAERISRQFGRRLRFAVEGHTSHYDDGPVSLIGSASVAAVADEQGSQVHPARFRPNIVLEGVRRFAESDWIGREVRIGTVVLRVEMSSPRCVMVDMATADLPAQPGNLAATGRLNDACLGVVASVVVPGLVSVGDTMTVQSD